MAKCAACGALLNRHQPSTPPTRPPAPDHEIASDADLHWDDIAAALDADGYALTPAPVVERDQCRELVEGFDRDHLFRSTVDMAGHRFGEGVYRYYAYPLPPVVAAHGEIAFPLQITIALTRPGVDFQGGENLFVEQRPRAQSRGTAVTVPLGHAVIFPTRYRPMAGSRGVYRATMRHGVSTVTAGERFTLGIISHEAA